MGEKQSALERLCQIYWQPLYYYARRLTRQPADAQDLVQGFFHRLIEKEYLALIEKKETGSFRGFLKCALERYRIDEWRSLTAVKRGGGSHHLSLDFEAAERDFGEWEIGHSDSSLIYDRLWALVTLGQALEVSKNFFVKRNKEDLFEFLKKTLPGQGPRGTYQSEAERLGVPVNTLKSEVKRFREEIFPMAIRQVVSETVNYRCVEELDEEIRYLVEIVTSP